MNDPQNRLGSETSPYLLQHADNPVHWRPWDPDALAEAVREDKPILLSIGYSACHWCHVMAHESFEDEATAELMNRLYVNIKVDREERPDLDRIYQLTHQMLTRRPGGWPLTMVLTPRGHAPIFAGTYFPREPRHGMPAFRTVLEEVEAHYRRHREDMDSHDDAFRESLGRLAMGGQVESPANTGLPEAVDALMEAADRERGGFGRAPKFPHATALGFLLDRLDEPGVDTADVRTELVRTLDAMSRGGTFDQLAGGFFRYSVDDDWSVPHFEKMLYDNALLLPLYARAGALFDKDEYRSVAAETAQWAIREMQLSNGGFCSSLDADSEGEEGRFYVFEPGEIEGLLDERDAALARALFALEEPPNFDGKHHLNQRRDLAAAAAMTGMAPEAAEDSWLRTRRKLLDHRASRTRPGRDDKCLTSWNALMIKGLAESGRLLGRKDFVEAADHALSFLRERHSHGVRLFASSRDGVAHLDAYLDDYAFLADALLEILKCRWREEDLEHAIALVDHVLDHFGDPDGGGLFFTSDEHEQLLHRPKVGTDESIPSGNGVFCRVLLTLGGLLGEPRYHEQAQSILSGFGEDVFRYPAGHGALLAAHAAFISPPVHVVIVGDPREAEEWRTRLNREPGIPPETFVIADGAPGLVPQTSARLPARTAAWVCAGSRCLEPATSYGALRETLSRAVE